MNDIGHDGGSTPKQKVDSKPKKKIREKIIKVTLETHYVVPDYLQHDMAELMQEWFVKFANGRHATKDAWHVGNSNKIIQIEEVDEIIV